MSLGCCLAIDRYGRMPLVYAVWNKHVDVIKLLLKAGALRDDVGGTSLSYALCNGHDDVLKLLFKKGTKIDSEDSISRTLLFPLRRRAMRLLLGYCLRQATLLLTRKMRKVGRRYHGLWRRATRLLLSCYLRRTKSIPT